MQRIAVKICGLSTPVAVEAAVKSGADYVGFVFFPKSPRNISFETLDRLAAAVPEQIAKVAVVVDPGDALLDQLATTGSIDIIQFHGNETPERVAQVSAKLGLQCWKAVPVKVAGDLARAEAFKGSADFILFDAKTPESASLPGGMGVRFDWTLLQDYRAVLPWGLSGGLDASSVRDAVGITGTRMVDVSSGVESSPGIKDVDKIAAFCKAVSLL